MRSRVLAEAVALVAPPRCAGCDAALVPAADPLCRDCRRELPWLRGSRCERCALPAPCPRPCPAAGAAYERAWSPLAYAGPARALVAALKFRGALALADLMAAQIAATAPPGMLAADAPFGSPLPIRPVLVPVPAHPARRRRRGFDPGPLLARALAHRTGLPLAAPLRRQGAPARQLGASRDRRLAAGRLAFEVRRAPPPRVLLVDDVHTTGATLDACARALRAAGCRRVEAVAYARALRG